MGISPLRPPSDRAVQVTPPIPPSRTYLLDFDTGVLGGYVEGEAAIRQFIRKAIVTARYHFAVYGTAYGCELEDLIGQDVSSELLNAEIPRVVREALIYDRRINDVSNFVLRREGDLLFITFDVSTVADVFTEELTL